MSFHASFDDEYLPFCREVLSRFSKIAVPIANNIKPSFRLFEALVLAIGFLSIDISGLNIAVIAHGKQGE